MTNREKLSLHKDEIARIFKIALKAQIAIWDCDGQIEQFVGEIDGLSAVLTDYADNYGRPGEVDDMTVDEILEIVEPLLENPDEE